MYVLVCDNRLEGPGAPKRFLRIGPGPVPTVVDPITVVDRAELGPEKSEAVIHGYPDDNTTLRVVLAHDGNSIFVKST